MRPSRSAFLAVPAIAAVLLLAGCGPAESVDPRPDPTSTRLPTATASATPTPTPTAEKGTPVTLTCEDLVSATVMYDFNPNFSLRPDFVPALGSLAAEAVSGNGIACQWVNQTSGVTIDLSVAHPPAAALTVRMNDLISSSNSVPTYGVEGYFQVVSDGGSAQVFPLPYWITAVSPAFNEPGDAAPIITAMIEALA